MVRAFLDTWKSESAELPTEISEPKRIGLITGRLAEEVIKPLVARLNRIENLEVDLLAVDNDYFGHGITVSGLLTGRDIVARLRGEPQRDAIVLPPNCINGDGLTLDDMTVSQLIEEAGVPITVGSYDLMGSIEKVWSGLDIEIQGEGRQLTELGYYIGPGQ